VQRALPNNKGRRSLELWGDNVVRGSPVEVLSKHVNFVQSVCGFSISSGARLVPDSFCSQGCPGNHTLACGGGNVAGTAITTIYQRENIVGTLAALATLAVPSQSLVSLIQTVTVANAATVGPVSPLD